MKVKNLFLSMCAIAALASCSQNEDAPAPTGSDAPEAKVIINLTGGGGEVGTKASVGEGNAMINDLTVFFFNQSGAIIGTPHTILKADLTLTPELTTTTDATQVIVIANANGATFSNITNIDLLKAKVASSVDKSDVVTDYPILQKETSLTMSGWGTVETDNEHAGQYKAVVNLHHITAKISSISLNWTSSTSSGKYGTWFTVQKVYLMMAQTNSTFIAKGATDSSWPDQSVEKFTPPVGDSQYAYTGGVEWGTTGWTPVPNPKPLVSTAYLQTTGFGTSTNNTSLLINLTNPWYVFENANSNNKTGVIIEYTCKVSNGAGGTTDETRFFTVYFGEKNIANIKGANNYSIKMTTSVSFDPNAGTGGGGTPDPTKPTESSSVTVNVTAADWEATPLIEKNFD